MVTVSVKQPVNKLPSFYVTLRFIILYITPPLDPIQSQNNLVHLLTHNILKIRFKVCIYVFQVIFTSYTYGIAYK
jgi:hypothetical protein